MMRLTRPQADILLLTVTLMAIGCQSETKRVAKPPLVGWRPIGAWSGRGNTQTDSFNIESGQLRIRWETKNEAFPGVGAFKVTVHSAVSGRPIALAVEHRGDGRDTAYVTDEPRLYHLVIESSDVDWTVVVQEAVTGAVQNSR
jgi:hypothetical protein